MLDGKNMLIKVWKETKLYKQLFERSLNCFNISIRIMEDTQLIPDYQLPNVVDYLTTLRLKATAITSKNLEVF